MDFHGTELTLESGWVAKQANGAVLATYGETTLLATVCGGPGREGIDFFPLVVEYKEKAYAAGYIPGGFFKREGRPTAEEVLVCRLIDRPVRPLFPDGYRDEVQIIINVLASDGKNPPDTVAMLAASAALHISDLPFQGPIGALRIGRVDGKHTFNPDRETQAESDMDFILAAKKDAIVMVEGGANSVPESEVLDALYAGHEEIKKLIKLQDDLRDLLGKEKVEFVPKEQDAALVDKITSFSKSRVEEAMNIPEKAERKVALKAIKSELAESLSLIHI